MFQHRRDELLTNEFLREPPAALQWIANPPAPNRCWMAQPVCDLKYLGSKPEHLVIFIGLTMMDVCLVVDFVFYPSEKYDLGIAGMIIPN